MKMTLKYPIQKSDILSSDGSFLLRLTRALEQQLIGDIPTEVKVLDFTFVRGAHEEDPFGEYLWLLINVDVPDNIKFVSVATTTGTKFIWERRDENNTRIDRSDV